ncbi:hypothetical protein NL676_022016 [Syzygium grande]|nr:hypothetical protein NL676_022016 [Syzygium grande]
MATSSPRMAQTGATLELFAWRARARHRNTIAGIFASVLHQVSIFLPSIPRIKAVDHPHHPPSSPPEHPLATVADPAAGFLHFQTAHVTPELLAPTSTLRTSSSDRFGVGTG